MLLDVTSFGAIGDASSDCTDAISRAIAAAASHSRSSSFISTVLIPPGGTFLTRPLFLPGNIRFRVEGVLKGMTGKRALSSWPTLPPIVTYGRDRDGAKKRRYQALLFSQDTRALSILGNGVVDGNGPWWWTRRHKLRYGRPHLIEVFNCTHVDISGITLRNSAFWTLHPVFSTHVFLHDLFIRAPLYAPNTDGIDPDSCRHVIIERCDISCGDDHVAVKSGMNSIARDGFPKFVAEDIIIRDNIFRTGMGVTVGSETAGGVRRVLVHNNSFFGDGVSFSVALHVKSAAQRGGEIADVTFRDNRVHNTSSFMRLDAFGRSRSPSGRYLPTAIRRVTWESNMYTPHDRKVRSKFICPAGGAMCENLVVVNNIGPRRGLWQCESISNASVSNNTPAGLNACMRRIRPRRHAAASAKQVLSRRRRFRKFDWKTGSAKWSTATKRS